MKQSWLFLLLLIMSSCLQAMQSGAHVPVPEDSQASVAQNVCPICVVTDLDHAREDNPTFVLLCGHRFCRACITRWLHQRYECPMCTRRFERGMHWPLVDHYVDRINMLNNIVMWIPTVSLTACISALLFLIIRSF